jgi:hypothetical protein
MSLEAAYNLSVPELLYVLNKKLDLECTRMLVPSHTTVTSLESEVSEPRSTRPVQPSYGLTLVDFTDRQPRSQSPRYLEAYPLPTKRLATSQQVAIGDPLSYCS